MPGSMLMYADISAPDLFLLLKETLMNMAVLEGPQVMENEKFWKLSYKINIIQDPLDDLDDELMELLVDNPESNITNSCHITAEILKIEDEDGSHVIEFLRKDGSPQQFLDHASQVIQKMLPPRLAQTEEQKQ